MSVFSSTFRINHHFQRLLIVCAGITFNIHTAYSQTQIEAGPLYLHESHILAAPEQKNWQWFGFSTAVDGDTLVICAKGENQFTGAVYVYQKRGDDWSDVECVARLTASDGQMDDQFGHVVSIFGDTVVVGTYCNQRVGRAYVFEKPEDGWRDMTETAILSHPDAVQTDFFGSSVEVNGETIVIGAYGKHEKRGAVYLYQKDETGWENPSLVTELTVPELEPRSVFGYDIVLENDTLVVGCYGEYLNAPAFVFVKPQSGWRDAGVSAVLKATDSMNQDHFGCAVAIDGDTIVVGANRAEKNGQICGAAYIFEKPRNGWRGTLFPQAKLTPSIQDDYLCFGNSVDIKQDHIVIGGFRNTPHDLTYAGSVYVFQKPDNGWSNQSEDYLLTASNASPFDFLGYSVVMQDTTVFAASYSDDQPKQDCGSVMFYNVESAFSRPVAVNSIKSNTHETQANDNEQELDYPFQSNRLVFQHYGINEGLNILPVELMLEDHQGYMWFGSSRGLCRFNGYQFQQIGEDLLPGQELPDTNITCLLEDQNQQLWVGTRSGIAVFDPSRESIWTLLAGDDEKNSLSSNVVLCMEEDQNGIIWMGTDNGLNRFDPTTGEITPYIYSESNPNSIPEFPVSDLEIDESGKIWIAFRERVFCRFDPQTNTSLFFYSSRYTHDWIYEEGPNLALQRLHPESERIHIPLHCTPNQLYQSKSGSIWVSGNGYNTIEIDPVTLQFQLHPLSRRFDYNTLAMGNMCMMEDRFGYFWFGHSSYGLYRLNAKMNEIAFEIHNPQKESTIAGNRIMTLHEDRSGNVWVSTNNSLNRAEKIGSRYRAKLISEHEEIDCWTIGIDHTNQVWLGTDRGIVKYDRKDTHQFVLNDSSHFFSDPSLNIEIVRCLEADPSGKLWVGTLSSGLGYFDLQDETFHRIELAPSSYAWRMLNVTNVKEIKLSDQQLWFGTVYSGLACVDLSTNDVQWFYSLEQNLKTINAILPSGYGSVFTGTHGGGLYRINSSDNTVTPYPFTETYSEWDQTKLLGSVVYSLHLGNRNDLWIATNYGINLLDTDTGKFRVWRQTDGLLEPGVFTLNASSSGMIFLAYPLSGIAMFDPVQLMNNSGTFQNLNQSEVIIRADETNQSIVSQDGSIMYLADTALLEIEEPYQNPFTKQSSSIIQIQSILINDKPVSLTRFLQPETLELPYWQNQFTIQYVVLDYLDPSNNISRYRLVQNGINDVWSNADGLHQIQYRDLSAGEYRFEIEGKHPSGDWGRQYIEFEIAPPYWQTGWFYTVSCILVVGLVYGVFAYRIRHIRTQNRMLEQEIQKRTTQLRTEMEYSIKILDSSPSIIFGFSTDGSLTYINPSGESILGCKKENMVGEKWWDLIAFQDDQEQIKQIHNELQNYDFYDQEMDLTIQTGKTHHLVWNFVNHFNEKGGLQETLAFGLDMTDQIEREIAKTTAKEQRRIGQEIHDSLCQTLTGVTLMCESLEKKRSQMHEEDASVISLILSHVKRTNDQSRRIAHGLYLHELEADGLETALIALAENIETLFRIDCNYSSNKPFSINDVDVSTQIYRIVQEAMSNAAKYSQASKISLQVFVEENNISFMVSDDGIGFKVGESSKKGMGLNIMRHRAKLIHTTVEIQSQFHKGTIVKFTYTKQM